MKIFSLALLWSTIFGLLAVVSATDSPPALPLWGLALDGNPLTRERLAQVEKETRFPFPLVVFFLQWPATPKEDNFPAATLTAIQQRQAIPCLTWEPMYHAAGKPVTIAWQRIVAGEYDPYLINFARQAREWDHPLIIRFAHEMNLNLYHWGTTAEEYGPSSPEIYRRIYRHVVELFRKEGAHKILWAFAPNAESVPHPAALEKNHWNQATNYYPGDDYVDLLGMDGYNWGLGKTLRQDGWDSHWQSFSEIFTPLYRELRLLSAQKPILVFEMASTTLGGNKEQWLRDALATSKKWQLAGLVWFEVEKELDWRLATGMSTDYRPILRDNTAPGQEWGRWWPRPPR